MRRLLITGAAGFIGFHLARHFAACGKTVYGIDNFNSYYDPQLKRDRTALLDAVGIPVWDVDICDQERLQSIVSDYAITDIVHMAAQAGVRYSSQCPQAYIKANLEGFVSILEACRAQPHIQLVYASSSSVYGADPQVPSSLTARADQPLSLYAATKRSNELMAYSYHHLYGIRSTGLRYFTVYGPWGRPDMAYYTFTRALFAGETLKLSHGGHVLRSFTYIDDIVAGTAAAVDRVAGCDIFNLGYPVAVPLIDLVGLLEKHCGVKALIKSQPLPPGDVSATCADISASTSMLGFIPQISLDVGLERFVSWYRHYHQIVV
jgi:UDP-glucuronate 4-epimerase